MQRPWEEISERARLIDELRAPGIPRGLPGAGMSGLGGGGVEVTVRTRDEVIGVTSS